MKREWKQYGDHHTTKSGNLDAFVQRDLRPAPHRAEWGWRWTVNARAGIHAACLGTGWVKTQDEAKEHAENMLADCEQQNAEEV